MSITFVYVVANPLGHERAVSPRWLAPPQWIAWIAALLLLIARWSRGERFSNYMPPADDLIDYIGAVVLIGFALGMFVFLRIMRIREVRRTGRARSGRARTPRS